MDAGARGLVDGEGVRRVRIKWEVGVVGRVVVGLWVFV